MDDEAVVRVLNGITDLAKELNTLLCGESVLVAVAVDPNPFDVLENQKG